MSVVQVEVKQSIWNKNLAREEISVEVKIGEYTTPQGVLKCYKDDNVAMNK